MPRGRIILKSISESKKLSILRSDGARLLYTWLIPHLDVNGCFSGDPKVINGKIFTRLSKIDKEIEEYLLDLEKNGLIQRYEVNGDIFLKVPDFKEKQPYLDPGREGKPRIPKLTPELLTSNSRVAQSQYNSNVKSNVNIKDNVALPPAPPSEVKQFLKTWGDLWSKEVGKGKTYICSFGKEGKIVKELLMIMTFKELSALAEKFFKSDDEFIQRTGYTIGVFKSTIPKLMAQRKPETEIRKELTDKKLEEIKESRKDNAPMPKELKESISKGFIRGME